MSLTMERIRDIDLPDRDDGIGSRVKFFTPWTLVLVTIMCAGAVFSVLRYVNGLDYVTSLDNRYPWGIWKAVNVAAVAAAGSSGFTMTALVHIFHKGKYNSMMRPSLVLAMLCYTFVGIGLIVDLGKYYDIWHPILPSMWQPNSALFEVAICVMSYLAVLYFEFSPIVFDRFRETAGADAAGGKSVAVKLSGIAGRIVVFVMPAVMILGVVLCCLHQSTLGTLMVIPAYKMHPLWYSPALPLLFLLSAVSVGLATAIAVTYFTSRSFGGAHHTVALREAGKALCLATGVYIAARIIDLALRENLGLMFETSARGRFFQAEFFVFIVLPFILLAVRRAPASPRFLAAVSMMLALGISLNRVNTYITAYMPAGDGPVYFPAPGEIAICAAMIAAMLFLYRVIAWYFPAVHRSDAGH